MLDSKAMLLQVGQAWHLAVAVNSHHVHIRAKALSCVRALASTFSPQEEELIVRLAKSLDSSETQQQHSAVFAEPSTSEQSDATLSDKSPSPTEAGMADASVVAHSQARTSLLWGSGMEGGMQAVAAQLIT